MVRSPTEKKRRTKTIVKAIKALTSALVSPSTSTSFASNSVDSSAQASEGDSSSLRLNPSDPRTCPSELKPESIGLGVINELEEEEDMSNELRASFKEMHCKRLHEAIDMVTPLAKRACLEGVQEEPEKKVLPMLVPSSDVAGLSSMPVVEKEACSDPRGASSGVAPVEKVLDQKDNPIPASPPSWDKMMDMLKCVPCFIDVEPPSTKMLESFPLTKRISVNLGGDPLSFVLVGLLFGTLKSAVSHI